MHAGIMADPVVRNTTAVALMIGAVGLTIGGFGALLTGWSLVPFGAAIGCATAAVLLKAGLKAATVTVFALWICLIAGSASYVSGVVSDPASHTDEELRAVERAAGLEPGELDELFKQLEDGAHLGACMKVYMVGIPVAERCGT